MKRLLALSLVCLAPTLAFAKKETLNASAEATKINWSGKKIIGGDSHTGELKLKSGKLEMDGTKLVGGEFVVDMTTLKNTDLTNEGMNQKLVGHLKSDDFFSVEKHPTATVKITKVDPPKGDTYMVTGDLTIKGTTKPVTFPVTVKADKGEVTATSKIVVDRTIYDVRYNSLKFFSKIGDKAIDDKFTVDVNLVAKK